MYGMMVSRNIHININVAIIASGSMCTVALVSPISCAVAFHTKLSHSTQFSSLLCYCGLQEFVESFYPTVALW